MPEPYEIEESPVAPALPGGVLVRPSEDDAIAAAAGDVMLQALACVRQFGAFHLALPSDAGGVGLVMRLLTDPNYRGLPWSRTHAWAVFEGRRTPDDEGHWMQRIGSALIEASDLPEEQAHPIHGHLHDADQRYDEELCAQLSARERGHDRLDCVVLSACPDTLRGHEDPLGRLVGPTPTGERVGLTARAMRGARLVIVLAHGAPAKPVLDRFALAPDAVGVRPDGGAMRWYLDRLACGHENLE